MHFTVSCSEKFFKHQNQNQIQSTFNLPVSLAVCAAGYGAAVIFITFGSFIDRNIPRKYEDYLLLDISDYEAYLKIRSKSLKE